MVTSTCGKVCIVAPLPPPYGGMSLQADRLVSRLRDEGLSVDVIPTNIEPPRILSWVQKVPGLRTLVRESQYLIALRREVVRCDVVHHFSASGLYFFAHSLPLLLLGRIAKKNVVLNYRGGLAADFFKKWKWCAIPFLRMASQICVPSEFLQQIFADYGLRATLLPNIAQTERFAWKERTHFNPALLVTRHLDPMYNTECLLRAFRIVKARFPQATLSVAGDGSESAKLQDLVSRWNLSGVTFLGAVAHGNLPALYASHDIYINSSNVDNFPGALVEAACSGLPIVTTGAGGIPWMIQNRETGIVVPLNDDKALAAGVIEIAEHPEFGRSLAAKAHSWAQQFSWNSVFPKLLAAYGAGVRSAESSVSQPEIAIH